MSELDLVGEGCVGGALLRVACVQYAMRRVGGFGDFEEQVVFHLEAAAKDFRADIVVLPEYFSAQLLSGEAPMESHEGIRWLAGQTAGVVDMLLKQAARLGVVIVAGSQPVITDAGRLENVAMVIQPDGSLATQPKLHITPWERDCWGIEGGGSLVVVDTPKARVGVLVCYDVEFPEAARALADRGVDLLCVPYCTDDRQGHLRVTRCAAARAIENQVYVATAGVVGQLPGVPSMNVHYGRSAVFSPCDFGFARDGIVAEADPNVETLLVAELDPAALYRSREEGSVRPLQDRRPDLFSFRDEVG